MCAVDFQRRAALPDGRGSDQRLGIGMFRRVMTILRSAQALPFSSGLRRRYAGRKVGMTGMEVECDGDWWSGWRAGRARFGHERLGPTECVQL